MLFRKKNTENQTEILFALEGKLIIRYYKNSTIKWSNLTQTKSNR